MRFMTSIGCVLTLIASTAVQADVLVFNNGPFVTQPGAGFNGADISRAESSTISVGFNEMSTSGPIRVIDDFVIAPAAPAGRMALSSMTFHAFQGNNVTPNVNFTKFHVAVYDGNPSLDGVLIAGDFTTNRLLSSTFTNAYRISMGETSPQTATRNAIIALKVDMSWLPSLEAGTYWMQVSAVGDTTLAANPNVQVVFVTPHFPQANARQLFQGNWFDIWDPAFTLRAFCPGDYDKSNSVAVADIFAFLNDWFGGVAGADFNGADGLTIQDIFDFLNVWFTAC